MVAGRVALLTVPSTGYNPSRRVYPGGGLVEDVQVITMSFFLNISVNCYLVKVRDGFVLIDTGVPGKREYLVQELESAGCRPGNLRLILLTHGDFDHVGNAAYLRHLYDTKVAMHRGDLGFVERGDMFYGRKPPNALVRAVTGLFSRLAPADRFLPDVYLEDSADLSPYGLDAYVLNVTGHSQGSLVVFTSKGDLFCGDLIGNTKRPELWSVMDDVVLARESVRKLQDLPAKTVYPGHGRPFPAEELSRIPLN